jgi:hypothetical protein
MKKILGRVNIYKRSLVKTTSKLFQNSANIKKLEHIDKNSVKRVLISRPNHRLGNQLLLTPLVQEVKDMFPNCTVDLVVNGTLSDIIFENFDYVDKKIQLPKRPFKYLHLYLQGCFKVIKRKYDLSICAVNSSSSSRIFAKMARAKFKLIGPPAEGEKHSFKHIATRQLCNLGKFIYPNSEINVDSIPTLSIELSEDERKIGAKIVQGYFNNEKETISIFTFATGEKLYSQTWWLDFYSQLKEAFPDYNILEILPIENVSQINFEAKSYYSKDIREIAAVIGSTRMFIGADSGIMHLASSSNTTTIGLFSVTDIPTYEPYGNQSMAANMNELSKVQLINAIKKILDN